MIGLRSDPESFARQLWLAKPDLSGGALIAAEPGFSYNYYYWDVWGTRLLFERAEIAANYRPSIAFWDGGSRVHLLAQDGSQPQWLP